MKTPLAGALLCASLLTGCSTVESALGSLTVSSTQVQVAVNAFDGLEVAAAAYIAYCKPLPPGCSVAGVTVIHNDVLKGRTARANLEAFAAGNTGTGDIATLYNTLVAATNALNAAETQYGAAKS